MNFSNATLSSQYLDYSADNAIDGSNVTYAQSVCENGGLIQLKVSFKQISCVENVIIYRGEFQNSNESMDWSSVFIVNSETGTFRFDMYFQQYHITNTFLSYIMYFCTMPRYYFRIAEYLSQYFKFILQYSSRRKVPMWDPERSS